MKSVTIQKESFSDTLCQEILPLAQKCWDEGTEIKGETCSYHEYRRGVQIDPDFASYQRLETARALALFTMRDTALVGYIVAYTYRSPHHKKLIVANADSIYVENPYRGHSPVMIGMLLEALKAMGAISVGWAVSKDSPMYELLCALGFVGDEVIMEKLLCA